jgi:hypothetical protein
MNLHQFYKRRAIGFLILLGVGGLVYAFYSFNNYIYQEKQGDNNIAEPYRATLSGICVCLPHKDTTGPQTEECALGLKTEVGEYYVVDTYLMSQQHEPLAAGQNISANGLITPLELLSTNQWQRYPVEGIFSITDSLRVTE